MYKGGDAMADFNKENKSETEQIIEKTIKMYFDEKQKREKPKDKTLSFLMLFAMGGVGLYFVYLMSTFFSNF